MCAKWSGRLICASHWMAAFCVDHRAELKAPEENDLKRDAEREHEKAYMCQSTSPRPTSCTVTVVK